MTEAVNYS